MRIISKFRDYYDSVQGQGMDKSIIYLRDQKEILIKDNDIKVNIWGGYISSEWSLSTFVLGYCGKIYKIWKMELSAWDFYKQKRKERVEFFYDYESYKNFAIEIGYRKEKDFSSKWSFSSDNEFRDQDLSKLKEYFHEHQTPLFIIKKERYEPRGLLLVLNPCLKDYKFQTVKDTFQTYQDIQQFVYGVLNSPENKMVKISDEDKIHKHGFDEWSFRKLPTKGKK